MLYYNKFVLLYKFHIKARKIKKMDIKKEIDDLKKRNVDSFGELCISIREKLKKEEGNFSENGRKNIVAKLNDFLGDKPEKERNKIVCDIAEIMSDYDLGKCSVYEIEKKLFEIIGIKHPF